jgi:hypothetical protein
LLAAVPHRCVPGPQAGSMTVRLRPADRRVIRMMLDDARRLSPDRAPEFWEAHRRLTRSRSRLSLTPAQLELLRYAAGLATPFRRQRFASERGCGGLYFPESASNALVAAQIATGTASVCGGMPPRRDNRCGACVFDLDLAEDYAALMARLTEPAR